MYPSVVSRGDCTTRVYCTISFNSYVTRHGSRNIRKFSYLSRVTEGIYECAKTSHKIGGNSSKNQNFARTVHISLGHRRCNEKLNFRVEWSSGRPVEGENWVKSLGKVFRTNLSEFS